MMGFVEWLKRKKEEARDINTAKSEARREFYKSNEYRKIIADAEREKLKKKSQGDDWLGRVSKNAAESFKTDAASFSRIDDKLKNDKFRKRKDR